MELTIAPIQAGNTIERIRLLMEGPRRRGIHVSDLLLCLRQAWAKQHGLITTKPTPHQTLLFATGRAIQDYITASPASVAERMVMRDGIHGTPDYHDDDDTPWEIKATYSSAVHDIRQTSHYFDQLAAYLAMEGKTEGYLAVYYLNGNYNFQRKQGNKLGEPGERSILRVWHVQYTAEELKEHWDRLLQRKQILAQATQLTDIPLTMHYEWLC